MSASVVRRGRRASPTGDRARPAAAGRGADVVDVLGRAPRTVAIGPSTARITSATEDLGRRPRECIPPRPALARDELLVAKLDEDALEELPRDRLRGRELLALHQGSRCGEFEHRAQRVVDLGGDAHRGTVSRTPRQLHDPARRTTLPLVGSDRGGRADGRSGRVPRTGAARSSSPTRRGTTSRSGSPRPRRRIRSCTPRSAAGWLSRRRGRRGGAPDAASQRVLARPTDDRALTALAEAIEDADVPGVVGAVRRSILSQPPSPNASTHRSRRASSRASTHSTR